MARQLLYFLKKNYLYILTFTLLLVFSVHNFDSIGQDIGRHLKIGEIIWQTKEVPKTNLFSFAEPDFSFINHHWLSEVIFFKIFSFSGFTGLILIKIVLIFIAFLLLFFIAKSYAKFWPLLISFLLSIFIFIQRTEVRPEIFSFVILSFFLFALFRAKYERDYFYLWFLPALQLLWVNLHIYFFIGPLIFLSFLVDRIIDKKINSKSQILNYKQIPNYKFQFPKLLTIFILIVLATLINPNGFQGALLPFKVLNEYGYSIVENQTLSFLADFFGFSLSIFVFKISAAILILSLILTLKKSTHKIFEIVISAFFIYAGFRMLRNLPLYALVSFPVMAIVLSDMQDFIEKRLSAGKKTLSAIFKILVSAFLILLIFLVANNNYYEYVKSSRAFGFSVPNGLSRAVDFVKDNKIEGPMFNNFDIGGYLIWRLYPDEKVFVDNRPEAYSVKFFNEIYKPMQEDKKKWLEFSEKYGINFVFFGHTDVTPWGQNFIKNIVKNPNWEVIYINENAIILVKDNKKNSEIISKLSVTDKNAVDKVVSYIKDSNENKINLDLIMSRVFYNIDWREASVYFAEKARKLDPKNPRAYLYKGLVHAYYTDRQNQELAAENIKKAIDLGLKDSQYYTILGIVYMNLGRLDEAKMLFIKALELDENNKQAKEFLNKFFSH